MAHEAGAIHATQEHVDAYVAHLRDDLGRAERTVDGTRAELELLIARQVPLTKDALTHFVNHKRDGTRLAPQSRNRRLTMLRGFLKYLRRKHVIPGNPLQEVRRAPVPERVVLATTFAEVLAGLETLGRRPPSWQRTRDGTILLVLFYTALRVSELRALDLDQVDLVSGTLRDVRRKGGKLHDVALHESARGALMLYLPARPPTASRALFVARHGDRPSVRNIQKMLARLGREAGCPGRFHPHALRHACATELTLAGAPSSLVQRHLAHESLATTERYVHVLGPAVRAAVDRLPSAPIDVLTPPKLT